MSECVMEKLKDIMTKGDWVLIAILGTGIVLSFFVFRWLPDAGRSVSVSVDGREVYRIALSEDREICVRGCLGDTRIRIAKGKVWIAEAPCPQKFCRKMGRISRSGEVIVCVPNRIFIRVEGPDEQNLDATTM